MNIQNSVLDYITYKQLDWYGHVQRIKRKGYLEKFFQVEEEEEKEDLEFRGCRK